MEDLKKKISNVQNPETGKTLGEESRVTKVEYKGESLMITLQRDGITPESKRKLEDAIIEVLKGDEDEDNIFILSESKKSDDIYKAVGKAPKKEASKPAELKVGHGQVGEKKRIPNVGKVPS